MDKKTLVEIGTASTAQIEKAQWLFGHAFSGDFSWVSSGVMKRFYRADVVRIDSVDRYIIFYHVNQQNSLVINAVAQLSNAASDFSALIQSIIHIAKKYACKTVEGVTLRRGMVEKLYQHGFEPCGVCMVLNL